ncbi:MAG: hypothetical protein GY845_22815 [Planctomycetes bacterium]|nr:hypothetical protein [Planctomycetota bacterium]
MQSSPILADCTFSSNSVTHDGGGMDNWESSNPTLTGCTFSSNSATNGGGGMSNWESNPTVTNCRFVDNSAESDGGGMRNESSNPTLAGCTFSNNLASRDGGGMENMQSSPILTDCTFSSNSAIHDGGGMDNWESSNPTLTGCTFSSNSATNGGGGMSNWESNPTVTNCRFVDNSAESDGGGMRNENSNPTLTGCTFSSNSATRYGGGMDNYESAPELSNCRFVDDNSAELDGGGMRNWSSNPTLAACTFSNNLASRDGGGMDNMLSSPILTDCTFSNNSASRDGGGMDNWESVPKVTDCIFSNNIAGDDGGGVHNYIAVLNLKRCTFIENQAVYGGGIYNHLSGDDFAYIVLDNCVFQRNLAIRSGGGMYNHESDPNIANCTFNGNRADFGGSVFNDESNPTVFGCMFNRNLAIHSGGGIYNSESIPNITNCTFAHNTASDFGGAIDSHLGGSPTILANCILWDNRARYGGDIALRSGASITLSYCDIQGHKTKIYIHEDGTANWGDGNIDVDPNLTPSGHLRSGSGSIDAADNSAVPPDTSDLDGDGDVNEPIPFDIDGDPRFANNPNVPDAGSDPAPIVDMGADEFVDSDDDMLPDWWEQEYFGDPRAAEPDNDPDGDGLTNLDEYEFYSSDPIAPPVYVDAFAGPIRTIQEGIEAADDGDTVLVPAGTYKGEGNKDIDFAGKLVVLNALDGPEMTIIDCEGSARGFHFHSGEGPAAAVIGFTIINGRDFYGGAIRCEQSHPQIYHCILRDNAATFRGGAIYCENSVPTLADCTISQNTREGIYIKRGGARIDGIVELVSNDWMGNNLMLTGPGTLHMRSGVTFNSDDSRIRCNISGPGTIKVCYCSELIIEGVADVNLVDGDTKGTIQCDGLLRARDSARISNAHINVTRASFEGDVNIYNNVITAEAGAPYGQFFIEGSVKISDNKIHADGDRYMDMDRSVFDGFIENNRIYVTITEGKGQTRGGLLELRGQDGPVGNAFDPNEFLRKVDPVAIPAFDPNSWALEELKLEPGAKLNLTNRFDFQAPYYSGGDDEVLYVKELSLGPNSVLNTAFNRIYCGKDPNIHPTAQIKNVPLLGFSLVNISFDDENDYITRVKNNNYIDEASTQQEDTTPRHVERVADINLPDPCGVMRMQNLRVRNPEDNDPNSPTYTLLYNARAKGLFSKSNEDRILVMFEYLFETDEMDTELVVYLSDVPELQTPRNPNHHLEVGRISPPRRGRPGSVDSGRFGIFHTYANRGQLGFIRGTRVELELVGPEGASVLINNWDPQIQCSDECMNLDGEAGVTVDDLKPIIAAFGNSADLGSDGTGNECVDGILSGDGHVDSHDVISGEWAIINQDRNNLCPETKDRSIPLGSRLLTYQGYSIFESRLASNAGMMYSSFSGIHGQGLVILGKMQYNDTKVSQLITEGLYFLNDGSSVTNYQDLGEWPYSSCNIKLVKSLDGELYQVNIEKGICRLDSDGFRECILVPGQSYPVTTQGRYYKQGGMVYVGLQYQDMEVYGRPIWDAVVTSDYIYAVPVVVKPDGNEPYLAAAKFKRLGGSILELATLYDDPIFFDERVQDNPDLSGLHEIEVDSQDNVYVLNTQSMNSSEVLWKYGPGGDISLEPLKLTNSTVPTDPYIPAPVGLCIFNNTLYLASGRNKDDTPDSTVYAFDTTDLSVKGSFIITNMEHVTDMTQDALGNLWVVGLNVDNEMLDSIESWNNVKSSFYEPCIALISANQLVLPEATVPADLITGDTYLGLPLSIVWAEEN